MPNRDLDYRWYSPLPLTSPKSGTDEDLNAGIALCAAMAYGQDEGWEYEGYVRNVERVLEGGGGVGKGGAEFAICTTPTSSIRCPYPPQSHTDTPYLLSIHKRAYAASRQVVAMLGVLWTTCLYEHDDGTKGRKVEVGRVIWVACRQNWRRSIAGEMGHDQHIVETLFNMLKEKSVARGTSYNMLIGLPNYYRHHGFEYAYDYGPLMLTPLPLKSAHAPTHVFSSRLAKPEDSSILSALHEEPAKHSKQWFSSPHVRAMVSWNLGIRDTEELRAIEKKEDGTLVPTDRMMVLIVLEKEGQVVGAIAMTRPNPDEAEKSVMISRVSIVDRYLASAAELDALGSELLEHSVEWANRLLVEEIAFDQEQTKRYRKILGHEASVDGEHHHAPNGHPAPHPTINHIIWGLSLGHPFAVWLRNAELAFPIPRGGGLPSLTTQWVSIPSLFLFAKSLESTFNARLAKTHIFDGDDIHEAHFLSLRICSWDAMHPGVEIVVSGLNKHVVSITEKHYRKHMLPLRGFDHDKVNVLAPWGTLIQLLMGYKSFHTLKELVPDLIVEDKVLPLLQVLFPVSEPDCHIYF
ncbi:hypothetical protein BT69DRAFT_1355955 [Atractiella rhizophila]|nr:hypothetical protein BT69DRAFT_1355955 [Atractiella rhizophila]